MLVGVFLYVIGAFSTRHISRIAENVVEAINPTGRPFIVLLTLACWSLAPIWIRPVTLPGLNPAQRFAISATLVGAAFVWWLWIFSAMLSYGEYEKVGIAAMFGLLAAAIYLRLRWSSK